MTIAVVSWNERHLLGRCLESLRPEHASGRAEVWVVDNGSSDDSATMVRDGYPWVLLLELGENLGYGGSVNLVAERTRSPWLVASNQDVEPAAGALEAMVQAAVEHPDVAAVSPRLVSPDGSTQHSVHPFPTLGFTVAFNLGLHRLRPRLGERLGLEGYWDPHRPRTVDWAVGAFLLIRRDAFEAVGGFDPAQWLHAEDLSLGWRLDRAGWRTWHEPSAVVRHEESASTGRVFGGDLTRRWMTATYAWMARERGAVITWSVAVVNVLGAGLRFATYAALAKFAGRRFVGRRQLFRAWTIAHLPGLTPRRTARRAL